jgi:hypothetical protein
VSKTEGDLLRFTDVSDYGNAPEIIVDGISSIDFQANTVRLNYFSAFCEEKRLVLCIRWERAAWIASRKCFWAATNAAEAVPTWRESLTLPKH